MPRSSNPQRRNLYRGTPKAGIMVYLPIEVLVQIKDESKQMNVSQGSYLARLIYATGGLIEYEKRCTFINGVRDYPLGDE